MQTTPPELQGKKEEEVEVVSPSVRPTIHHP